MEVLPKTFYERDPETVARMLLGKKLVRRINRSILEGMIVETEAYYGSKDPASRAFHGMKNYNRLMWDVPGKVFIYNVHNYWMFNVVAHKNMEIGAVLIRALEPLKGLEIMSTNRGVTDIHLLSSGPGRLSRALKIDKSLNDEQATSKKSRIFIIDNQNELEIGTSHRIGVKKDLKKDLRFFIKGNKFVSR